MADKAMSQNMTIPDDPTEVEIELCRALADHNWFRASELMRYISENQKTIEPFTLGLLADYIQPRNRQHSAKFKSDGSTNIIKRINTAFDHQVARSQVGRKRKKRHGEKRTPASVDDIDALFTGEGLERGFFNVSHRTLQNWGKELDEVVEVVKKRWREN
jgi:hypothetical protein